MFKTNNLFLFGVKFILYIFVLLLILKIHIMTYLIKILNTNEIIDFNNLDNCEKFSIQLDEGHRIYSVNQDNDCEEIRTIWG